VAAGVGQSDQHAVAEPVEQRGGDIVGDRVAAVVTGLVRFVDQPAQRLGDLDRPHRVGVDVGGIVEVTQQMLGAQVVGQRPERGAGWVGPGRPAGIAPGGFPRPARRTRRANYSAPGAPRVLPAGQLPVAAVAGLGVHGVGMLLPRWR
jgi:hypothetical protein